MKRVVLRGQFVSVGEGLLIKPSSAPLNGAKNSSKNKKKKPPPHILTQVIFKIQV